MSFQGISRTEPPVCHGNNDYHCCWVDGQVCGHLVENDPRASDGRRWSCGLLLTLQDQFPNFDINKVWERVHRHPLYNEILAKFNAAGVASCGNFLGAYVRDELGNPIYIRGQCCFDGYFFDLDGNVIPEPGV